MNAAWEELHKREEQLRHIDKVQTLGTMTSMISHEFNNFLTPIMLYGDLLEADDAISEDNKALIREMIAAATKAKDLTKELSTVEKEAVKRYFCILWMRWNGV